MRNADKLTTRELDAEIRRLRDRERIREQPVRILPGQVFMSLGESQFLQDPSGKRGALSALVCGDSVLIPYQRPNIL